MSGAAADRSSSRQVSTYGPSVTQLFGAPIDRPVAKLQCANAVRDFRSGTRVGNRRSSGSCIKTKIGNHTFRATGITAYLKTAASSKSPSRLQRMSHRGRPAFTTGATMM